MSAQEYLCICVLKLLSWIILTCFANIAYFIFKRSLEYFMWKTDPLILDLLTQKLTFGHQYLTNLIYFYISG